MKPIVFISFMLIAALSIPQVRTGLESTMVGQMVVQIPLLAFTGYLFGTSFRKHVWKPEWGQYNPDGIPGLFIAIFTSIFWLLPRSLDAALNSTTFELAKYLTAPLMIGLPLAFSWGRLSPVVKGFIWANVISMLFVMGWLYANAPIRLCNNYLKGQQVNLGITLIGLSLFFLLSFFCRAFFIGEKRISPPLR
ncbi:hypothetical protein IEC97_08055 [Neobacillus cucumis]|uniref:hypothetical protein n=1 Tax=Neobacillus cucumis TaxID=1740721 RepID=UPI0018E0491D|nr:hypothetical protein [Neobacillus cucumis]MBI0577311.1 hypothetical protein [Neobacillus cucumis]